MGKPPLPSWRGIRSALQKLSFIFGARFQPVTGPIVQSDREGKSSDLNRLFGQLRALDETASFARSCSLREITSVASAGGRPTPAASRQKAACLTSKVTLNADKRPRSAGRDPA